jgi:hypothetical protein
VKETLSVEEGVGEPKVTDLESLGEAVIVAEAVAVIEDVKDPVPEEDGVALGLALKDREELPDALPSSVKETLSVEVGVVDPKVTDLE